MVAPMLDTHLRVIRTLFRDALQSLDGVMADASRCCFTKNLFYEEFFVAD
jgi:hypothetical protein